MISSCSLSNEKKVFTGVQSGDAKVLITHCWTSEELSSKIIETSTTY